MSIHFISGKPRGGKSLYAVKLCVEELVYGSRVVITNLAFKRPELNEYLQKRYPGRCVDLHERLIILDDKEAGRFWTIRPGGVRIAVLSEVEWKAGAKPDYSGVHDNGVMYAIDEIHNYFNARAWAETGRDVLFYLSQHGKLGDTVLCITQAIANVDKQFRSLTQDFTYLRNLKKERMGFFRMPGIFMRKTYTTPATPTSQPMESGTFTLDVSGLAACYETAKGVGIHGRGADKTERTKGIHWSVAAIMVPLVVICIFKFSPNLIAKLFTNGVPNPVNVLRAGVTNAVVAVVSKVEAGPVARAPESVIHLGGGERAVTVTSFCAVPGGKVFIGLSDGRSYMWPDDRAVELCTPKMIVIAGQIFRR